MKASRLLSGGMLAGLAASLFVASNMSDLLPGGEAFRLLAFLMILGLTVIGIFLAFSRGYFLAGVISTGLLLGVWGYLYLFAVKWGQPFNPAAGGAYLGAAMVGFYAVGLRSTPSHEMLRKLSYCIGAYALIYILVYFAFGAGLIRVGSDASLFYAADSSSARGARLGLAISFIALGIGLSLTSFMERKHWPSLVILALCVVALWFSQSRMITAITLAVCALYVVFRLVIASQSIRLLSMIGLAAFAAVVVASLSMAFGNFNPWDLLSRDISSRTRFVTTQILQTQLPDFWLIGTGTPSRGAGYSVASSSLTFYPSDVGLAGVIYQYGIIGFILYCAIAISGCFAWWSFRRLGVGGDIANGLTIFGVIAALYSFQAPIFSGGSGATLGALLMAAMIAAFPRSSRSSAPRNRMTRRVPSII